MFLKLFTSIKRFKILENSLQNGFFKAEFGKSPKNMLHKGGIYIA
jgi:hypothetical protein